MQTDELILAEKCCSYYEIEYAFIHDLNRFGLIEITSVNTEKYIPQSQLQKLEQLIRLHYELDINMEGIDAIAHLLERIKLMQGEIIALKNRLKLYDDY
jgi:hypothetical protein